MSLSHNKSPIEKLFTINSPDKMRRLILQFVVVLMMSCHENRKLKAAYFYNNDFEVLKDNVKQVVEIENHHSATEGNKYDTTNFDRNGNAVESRIKYSDAPVILLKYEIGYNKDEKKTETRITGDNSKMIILYNDDHNTVDLKFYSNGSLNYRTNYSYDVKGNITESDTYDFSKHHLSKWKRKYDDDGYLVEEFLISKKDEPGLKYTYRYLSFDKENNWTKRVRIVDGSGRIFSFQKNDTTSRKLYYY
jgi:hypothetical protein